MTNIELIDLYQNAIAKIYEKENIIPLRGLNNEAQLNGKSIYSFHSEVTNGIWRKNNGIFNYMGNLDDLFFCSDEFIYCIANIYLYKPYINDPIKEAIYFTNGAITYPNVINLSGKRFDMFCDLAGQAAYNYWSRIGDLIASYFPELIKRERVFFATAIEAIPSEFHNSDNYKWLKNFKIKEYMECCVQLINATFRF